MKKIALALGVIGAVTLGMGATDAETDSAKGWSIAGFQLSNPFRNIEISNPIAGINLKETFKTAALANPLALVKMPEALKDVRFGNPFDRSTWWDGADHVNHQPGETMSFNIADPKFWMSIPNPKTHSTMHGALTNPINWAQFLKPETYAGMRDMNVLSEWTKAESFDILLDPQTYAYWMQPGAYGHLVNIDHYKQLLNAEAYGILLDTAIGNVGLTFKAPENKLDAMGWLNSVSRTGEVAETKT